MKSKILHTCFFVVALLSGYKASAQNDEYYRPDSLKNKNEERREMPPVEKREMTEKKKKSNLDSSHLLTE